MKTLWIAAASSSLLFSAVAQAAAPASNKEEMSRLGNEFKETIRPHWEVIEKLYKIKNGKLYHGLPTKQFAELKEKAAALAPLATECETGKFANLVSPDYFEELQRKAVVCPLIVERNALLAQQLKTQAETYEKEHAKWLGDALLKRVKDGKLTDQDLVPATDLKAHVAAEKADFAKAFTDLGASVPETLFASWMDQEKALKDAFAAAVKVNRVSAFAKNKLDDPSITREGQRLAELGGLKALKVLSSTPAPDVEKSADQKPVKKIRNVLVVVQLKGETFCRAYERGLTSDAKLPLGSGFLPYQGTSRKFGEDPTETFLVTACK
ncbi:MAG: hypothetical protein QM765_37775 [Myxococcales bacterium]